MPLKPHSPAWYDRLSTLQSGYFYPWKSHLPPLNGEDVFLSQLNSIISPTKNILEVGCGHGELALQVAAACQTIVAYDRVPAYIRLAQASADQQKISNVTFICADSSITTNGQARIPAEENSFDVIYSRRGPLHWIDDARRVARRGAILIQLNPSPPPPPIWNKFLPEQFQLPEVEALTMEQTVRQRLAQNQLTIHSCWTFQLQETFPTPEDLYTFITWGHDPTGVPPLSQLAPTLNRIFHEYATPDGLDVPFVRFLWQAIVR